MVMGNKVLITAGGTGGHIFPAQSLTECLVSVGYSVTFTTDKRGLQHTNNIPASNILKISSSSISLRNPVNFFLSGLKIVKGILQSIKLMVMWKPDVVVGFGGYPSFPILIAAQLLRIPIIIHEQNAVLGRVNRIFAAKAKFVASGFEELQKIPPQANHICTGNPLRDKIIQQIPKTYKTPKEKINILIVGGSLGAKIFSIRMPEAIALLPEKIRKKLRVVQQTTIDCKVRALNAYNDAGVDAICDTFFSDIEVHLSSAHYVVSRAGASSISEISAMGVPSLLVPLDIAMDDHQRFNANALVNKNAADILLESEFTPENIKTILENRLNDSNWLKKASEQSKSVSRPNSASELTNLVISIIEN
jgi:UDP-N-acetylglucosamine--N-acetylmuramyl-(pentapeptide) pyrophosphoryl-undecaprenol N-acetylglucosamine transferase